jgi:hypothetical protein
MNRIGRFRDRGRRKVGRAVRPGAPTPGPAEPRVPSRGGSAEGAVDGRVAQARDKTRTQDGPVLSQSGKYRARKCVLLRAFTDGCWGEVALGPANPI